MILVGAPTGAGKTTLAVQLATTAAQAGGAVLLVSPEMSLESLVEREIIRRSGERLWNRNPWLWEGPVRDRCVAEHAKAAVEIATERLPILVLEELDVTMAGIESAAKVAAKEHGRLALVVIDYAQYVASTQDKYTPRYLQVGEVAERSVAMALRLNVPVVVASQVNLVKEGGGKRTYTFRESQILEHKASVVLVIDAQWAEQNGERTIERTDLVCLKNRSGQTFRLEVEYDPALYQISEKSAWVSHQPQHSLLPPPVPA